MHGFRVKGGTARRVAAVAILSLAAVAVAVSMGSAHRTAAAHRMVPDTLRSPHLVKLISRAAHPSGTVIFSCQTPLNDTVDRGDPPDPTVCYGPDQLRAAYGVDQLPANGAGKTIVIVDAFGSPSIQGDLAGFDATWGIPDPPSFTISDPYGNDSKTANSDDVAGWGIETSLDVEWAHSIAQGANIVLVEAQSDSDADILAATKYAVDHNLGDVISQSFGEAEQCVDPSILSQEHSVFRSAVQKGITLFASAGDDGAGLPKCNDDPNSPNPPILFKAASSPATDPNVTSVGGTTLIADPPSGAYQSESTWNETDVFGPGAAGGGGQSVKYREPLYQILAQHSGVREIPDVSYNAAILHGVIVADTSYDGVNAFWLVGGTSAGSPQWAGITAIVDQMAKHRQGNINLALYALSLLPSKINPFHDIADGSNNSVPDNNGGQIQGFTATRGYDMATGLGTPNIGAIAKLLAQQPASTTPQN